jgi:transcriptional regulator with XRE-family HTH domain
MMPTLAVLPGGAGIVRVRDVLGPVRVASVLPEEERKRRIAFVISTALTRRNMTPPQLAEKVGRSRGTVNDWESGRSTPSLVDLGPLCVALNVDPKVFAELPPIPADPLAEYLLPAAESGVAEGLRRARRRRTASTDPPPSPSPERRPRGTGAGRE